MSPLWCVLLSFTIEGAWALVLRHYRDRESHLPEDSPEYLADARREWAVILAFLVYHWPLVLVALALRDRGLSMWVMAVSMAGVAFIYAGLLLWLWGLM